jgi:hypothetical protein
MSPRNTRAGIAAALTLLLTIVGGRMSASSAALASIGGIKGTQYVSHVPGDVYEPGEDIAFDFDAPVDLASFTSSLTIVPASASRTYAIRYGKRVVVRLRKTPGATYHLHLAVGIRMAAGGETAQPIDLVVKTADDPIPAPVRATPNEPYRYGVLAHPYPVSLGGPNAQRLVDEFADAGVRFVRIDYAGAQIETVAGLYDFTIEDRIADLLAARGITELPIVLQYSAPKWATDGAGYPAIWKSPALYAQFAGAVAAHVAARYPRITRLELFNEPNLNGWWRNPADPAYAANDGSAAAQYLHGAYAAIKAAAPAITVVAPALASGGQEVDPRKFFENLYTGGCRRGACWDVLSVHNYRWENPTFPAPPSASNRFDIYRTILDIAAAHGDTQTHVMLTEWGYSTDESSPDGIDPQTQARYLALGFNLMLNDPLVDGIVYVNMYNPATDFWGKTALVSADFTPKPAYAVYRRFARGTP